MTRLMSCFKLFLLIIAFSTISEAHSATFFRVFQRHLNPVFISVNNGLGGQRGVKAALRAGFPRVIILEISQYTFEADFAEFGSNPNVELVLGNPVQTLVQTLTDLDGRATIWIRGAISPSIIIDELKAIADNPIPTNNHTIIIDNIDQFSRFNRRRFVRILRRINPSYNISRRTINGNNRILIAEPPVGV